MLCGMGCAPSVLDLGPVEAPPGAAPPREAPCAPACVGGRACIDGQCTPHWLALRTDELLDPAPRVGHYAVWTGRELLVWGGRDPASPDPSRLYGDGYRFDPRSGRLRAMSSVEAPSPRFQEGASTAVWTGREMIVWGGHGSSGGVSDGFAYLPEGDRWRPLGADPSLRRASSVVFTGSELLFFGGPLEAFPGLRFVLGTGLWLGVRSAPRQGPRQGQTAVWTGDQVLLWGGTDADGRLLAEGWRYDPRRDSWAPLATANTPDPRTDHQAVWTGEEMVLFGGRGARGELLAAPAAYVPLEDRWRTVEVLGAPSPRVSHMAVWTARGMVVWGGSDGRNTLADGAVYDPWSDRWIPLAEAPAREARRDARAVWTGTEVLIVAGTTEGPGRPSWLLRYQP
ncbi:MAG: hypothetical protein HY909_26220 [Deltaproteobacteria bacterium]|nr:hypothetical protein [Deltaproteobacteria bacterium]